tara:strand:+ start:1814 stop:2143 length:330 start_codon:yes stop_codon:yes gene_type:complete
MVEKLYVRTAEELEQANPGLNPRGKGRWGLTPQLVVLWRLMGDAGLLGREITKEEFVAGLKSLDDAWIAGKLQVWSDTSVQKPSFFWMYYTGCTRDRRILTPKHFKLTK